ncbi:MAG TPA: response regulator [Candidatus Xenobia bacterium]
MFMAENGQDALQLALKIKPDLVISDVDMPGMDGKKLCQKLKSYRTTRDIPVILLTGSSTVEDEADGLEAGAEDFVAKPVVPQRLVARVQAVLRRRLSRK